MVGLVIMNSKKYVKNVEAWVTTFPPYFTDKIGKYNNLVVWKSCEKCNASGWQQLSD